MTQPLQIIAFTGSAGTGKDTAADILATHCGFTRLAFADALRAEVQKAFKVPAELLTRRDLKEMPTAALALVECMRRRNPARTAGTVWAGLGSRAQA